MIYLVIIIGIIIGLIVSRYIYYGVLWIAECVEEWLGIYRYDEDD